MATAVLCFVITGCTQNTSPPMISGSAVDGRTLTASPGAWTWKGSISYAYQWRRCDFGGASCQDVSNATGTSYGLGSADVGSTLRVVVTATDADGPPGVSPATSAPTAVVAAASPANSTPPSISGSARAGQTLSATTGIWTGTPPLSYAYQWLRCDGGGGSCASIAGAASSTYVLGGSDVGATVRVSVTASNGGGSSSATSTATAVVAAKPHIIVIVEENMDRASVVGNSGAPYYNSLPQTADWHGISHPSLPNYLSLFSGSTQGTDGSDCNIASCSFPGVTSLATELAQAGIPYATYAEDMQGQCWRTGDAGNYVEHHNPEVYFPSDPGVSANTCSDYPTTSDVSQYGSSRLIQDLNSPSPPAFILYVPNLLNDGHDTNVAAVDASLSRLIPAIEGTSWWTTSANPKIIVTWDENSGTGGNQVATAVIGATPSQASGNHYGTLRSIEDAYGLARLGNSSSATPLF